MNESHYEPLNATEALFLFSSTSGLDSFIGVEKINEKIEEFKNFNNLPEVRENFNDLYCDVLSNMLKKENGREFKKVFK